MSKGSSVFVLIFHANSMKLLGRQWHRMRDELSQYTDNTLLYIPLHLEAALKRKKISSKTEYYKGNHVLQTIKIPGDTSLLKSECQFSSEKHTTEVKQFIKLCWCSLFYNLNSTYHIVPGTDNVSLLHFSLTLCLFIFFLLVGEKVFLMISHAYYNGVYCAQRSAAYFYFCCVEWWQIVEF